MSTLLQHSKSELRVAGLFDEDSDYNGEIAHQVVALMETLCAYGHSGGSLAQTVAVFSRLAQHKPLTPLTGDDSEWIDMSAKNKGGKEIWQNNRYSLVFKNKRDAWVVLEPSRIDSGYVGDGKVEHIRFPYTVK